MTADTAANARRAAGRRVRDVVLTAALGAAGGALFNQLGLPLAWMIGAMSRTTVASLAGAPVAMPVQVRAVMVAVLGVMLGSAFTPTMAARMADWWPSLLAVLAYASTVTLLLLAYFRKVAGYDWTTAYFSASPGGLNEMTIVGGEMGGDVRTISLIHASRVLFVVLAVPFAFTLLEGYDRAARPALGGPLFDLQLPDLAVLAACGVFGVIVARLLRMPAANLTGPMILSAAVHVAGITDSRPPAELVALAQLVVGAAIGCRFTGVALSLVLRTLATGAGATLIMLLVTAVFSLALAPVAGSSFSALVLALAPGGLAEMSLIALALGIDAAFVSTHHIVRIVMIVVVAPLVFRRAAARSRR